MTGPPVVLDTDIGTNVDDILALLVLATDATVSLRAVTTVDGDGPLRARHARRVLHLLGRDDVPVYGDVGVAVSDRPIWPLAADDLPGERIRPGVVDALVDIVSRSPGEVTVVAIGPLTNIAAAMRHSPGWAASLRQLIVMGGDFAGGRADHNVASDIDAAAVVLASGAPSRFVGLDVTTAVPFDGSDLDAVSARPSPLGALVAEQARAWWNRIGRPWSHPHDALAVLAMLRPELFTYGTARRRVLAGGSLAPEGAAPPVRYATDVDAGGARAQLRRRWSAALRAG